MDTLNETLIDKMLVEYEAHLTTLPRAQDHMDAISAWVGVWYAEAGLPVPPIEIAANPVEALRRASELCEKQIVELDFLGTGDDSWVATRDYGAREGLLDPADPDVIDCLRLRDFLRVAYGTKCLSDLAIVVPLPRVLHRDAGGNLHCETGPAIAWDGYAEYAWHGVWLDQRIIERPGEITRADIADEINTERRRAICERIGWGRTVELLGASVVDTWIDPSTGLDYTLLTTDTERWLRKTSPVLLDGSQPKFVEPVDPALTSAQAARRWQAPPYPSAGDCNRDPELIYGIER